MAEFGIILVALGFILKVGIRSPLHRDLYLRAQVQDLNMTEIFREARLALRRSRKDLIWLTPITVGGLFIIIDFLTR